LGANFRHLEKKKKKKKKKKNLGNFFFCYFKLDHWKWNLGGGGGEGGGENLQNFQNHKTAKKKETLNNRVRPWSGLNPSLFSGTNSGY
jgi:hypothetical protein